ncbi:hypothetical protein HORIV_54980 [Vreelandella olivaria]|uniref:Uncharacterized protein n=1 Tax=Vreelandella olivaria TaxID=390919 RepID=A0ABM7GQU0_9GAMM|nr:hypothetical protein HORIV_54980 [Halomonas olivaria]
MSLVANNVESDVESIVLPDGLRLVQDEEGVALVGDENATASRSGLILWRAKRPIGAALAVDEASWSPRRVVSPRA